MSPLESIDWHLQQLEVEWLSVATCEDEF